MNYGANAALLEASPLTRSVPPGGAYGGDVIRVEDNYTIVADDVDGSIIKMGRLLKGQRMLECILDGDGLGSNVVAVVGDQKKDGSAGVANRYITSTTVAAATTLRLNAPFTGRHYEATEDMDIIVTVSGADPTAGKKLKLTCFIGKK